jgi:hypothetical protein
MRAVRSNSLGVVEGGDRNDARAMYAEALDLYARMGDPEALGRCREALGRLATSSNVS